MNPKSFKFSGKDGKTLLGRGWVAPIDQPKGIIYLVHSIGEHSGRYDHVGNHLAKAGFHLVGFDLPGHGLSTGRRGHSPGVSVLLEDIHALIHESTKYLDDQLPKFLYGHGFGGNLVIQFGMRWPSHIRGFIVTSPFLSPDLPHMQLKTNLAKFMAKLFPGLRFANGFNPEALSRNSAIVQAYRKDVYVYNKVSMRLFLDLQKSGQSALSKASQWDAPLLLMHGSDDRITSIQASEQFFRQAGSQVEFVRLEGFYHELHHDIGHETVIEKIIQWLNQQIS